MSELKRIKQLARHELEKAGSVVGLGGFFWDRAQRLSRNVEQICRLPEVCGFASQLDTFSLLTAVYFSDIGLALHIRDTHTNGTLPDFDLNNGEFADASIQAIENILTDQLPAARIALTNRIISESYSRSATLTESMILSDARNLDDMGAVGIFNEFRRYVIGSKSVSDVLQIWKRKIDYRYWQARLKENFCFETVRTMAQRRIEAVEQFMDQMALENEASDVELLETV